MIAAATVVTVLGGYGLGRLSLNMEQSRHKSTFLKSAVALMEDEPKIKELLGEKYRIGSASLNDGFTKQEPKHVQLKLPVMGNNDNAFLYTYARRKSEDEKFKLYKIEMTFSKVEGKKLILLDLGKDSDATYMHDAEKELNVDTKAKAREELMKKMDEVYGPLSPSKQWKQKLKSTEQETSSDTNSTSK